MMDDAQGSLVAAAWSSLAEDVEAVTRVEPVAPVAPWWHTLALLVMLLSWVLLARGATGMVRSRSHVAAYASTMMTSWMLLGFTVAGIYSRSRFFFDSLKRKARGWRTEFGRAVGFTSAFLRSCWYFSFASLAR